MRRFWPIAVLCAGVALLLVGRSLSPPPPKTPPNVVLLLLDALRADRVGAERNGIPVMPYLTQLTREGLYFTRAVSPCSWTRPAMASLLTSTDVDTHQVYFSAEPREDGSAPESDVLADALETMAEYLASHGYDTAAFQSNANLTPQFGFAQGFTPERYPYVFDARADEVTMGALGLLKKLREPFFLYAHYMDPHTPYEPPEKYHTLFGPAPDLEGSDRALLETKTFREVFWDQVFTATGVQSALQLPDISAAGREFLRLRYDGEVRFMDDEVARLIRGIRMRYPNTVLIIMSDHGEEFWERGGMGHGTTLHEEVIHVPLWMIGPGINPQRVDTLVGTLGLLPTLAEHLSFPPNPVWQGSSWLPAGAAASTPVFSRTRAPWTRFQLDLSSITIGTEKLIVDNRHGVSALYDLSADRDERRNLAAERPDRVAALEKLVQAQQEQDVLRSRGGFAARTVIVDADTRASLEAIGYLQGDKQPAESAPVETPIPTARKSVLLIIVDTLRADRITARRNGLPVMPAAAAFAEKSWQFTQCATQATWTKPSVVSILTGLFPETHKVQFGTQKPLVENQRMTIEAIPAAISTLNTFFKKAGYATGAVQTNPHLRGEYGFGRDCDRYEMIGWKPAVEVTDAAIAVAQTFRKPFFLYVHYIDLHAPYEPAEPYYAKFGPPPPLTDEDRRMLDGTTYAQAYYLDKILFDVGVHKERKYGEFSDGARAHILQCYDSECRSVDVEAARLIEAVHRLAPETIVVFTSDHGEEFWEHGSIGHSKTVYQELVHVPLIIQVPGDENRIVDAPVATIDIAPTLAECTGLAPLANWQGRSLALSAGRTTLDALAVFSQTRGSIPEMNLDLQMVEWDRRKLILDRKTGKAALYNLTQDPKEIRNCISTDPETEGRLRLQLEKQSAALARHPLVSVEPVRMVLGAENREALEAIGYLPGGEAK